MANTTSTYIVNGVEVTREHRDNRVHALSVQWFENNHGYPYRAECSTCGWKSAGYVTRSAARGMADDHMINA